MKVRDVTLKLTVADEDGPASDVLADILIEGVWPDWLVTVETTGEEDREATDEERESMGWFDEG